MKKLLFLVAAIGCLVFTGCSKDDDSNANSLSGTTWTTTYVDELWVIEFNGNNGVTAFRADANLNIKGSAHSGTYSKRDNSITFQNLYISDFYKYEFMNATVNGNTMTVNYQYTYHSSGEVSKSTKTFHKR